MGSAIRRYPVNGNGMTPVDEHIRRAAELVVEKAGGLREAGHFMSGKYPSRKSDSWERCLVRIKAGGMAKMNVESAEAVLLTGLGEIPPPLYRQKVWKVIGYLPYPSCRPGIGAQGSSTHIWFYTREWQAKNRAEKLRSQGKLVEWAVCDAVWEELPPV